MSGELDAHEHGLIVTADLITAESSSPYLIDASGYLQTISHIVARDDPEDAARTARAAMRTVGEYAAASDNTELADYTFNYLEDPADRWHVYGIAAVAGTIEHHPEWSLWATSEETLEATNRHQSAQAAMYVAQTKIALAEYTGSTTEATRQIALAEAVSRKQDARRATDIGRHKEYETGIIRYEIEECHLALDSLFAERGLWREVDSPNPGYPLYKIPLGNQLVAKAAIGALDRRERRRLRRSSELSDLLLVDAIANGEIVPERDLSQYNRLTGNPLLAAAAPKAYVHLGLATPQQLDTYLKAGKIEEAAREYLYMQRYANAHELLTAALQMAPFTTELAAVQGAYCVYRMDVARKIDYVQDFTSAQDWRVLPSGEADAMQPIIGELGEELYSLDERVDRLLASVRQFNVAQDVDPSSEETSSALYLLRETWDELELMESCNDMLPELASVLRQHGIIFVNEWKLFSSNNGYIGYGLAAPAAQKKETDDDTFFLLPYKFDWWRDAARMINELHGEDRFVFVEYPETQPGTGENSHEMQRRVGIEGNWRARGLGWRELVAAEGVASWETGSLNTLPRLTDRLMALQLADV